MSLLQKKQPLRTLNGNRLLGTYGSLSLRPNTGKRKSAVEMLQETKAFYVKSERVLDAKQEMKHADHLQISPTQLCAPLWPRYSEPPAVQHQPPPPLPPPPRPPASLPPLTPDRPPPLPPRSPGYKSKPRARTPTEGAGRGVPSQEPRRCQSGQYERRRSGDDVQSQLRRLLVPTDPTCGSPPALSASHKSLPDIAGPASEDTADSCDSTSMAGHCRSRGRATSDYVSRSPASNPAALSEACRPHALTDHDPDHPETGGWLHRPVTRSKSDISHKYGRRAGAGAGAAPLGVWRSEPLYPRPPPAPARPRRVSCDSGLRPAQLERFFDQLGMDCAQYSRLTEIPADHWSPVVTPSFWDGLSASSSQAGRRRSLASECSSSPGRGRPPEPPSGGPAAPPALRALHLIPAAVEPSIVEKNARIVKWLFHCRKAQEGWSQGAV